MEDSRFHRIVRGIGGYVVGLSIRWKIALSILSAFIIILPSVSLSLFYFTSLLSYINVITEQDVAVGRMATNLSMTMLDIRRDERNYRMFGDVRERENVQQLIAHADSLLDEVRTVAPSSDMPLVNELADYLNIYANTFRALTDHIGEHPPESQVEQKNRLTRRLGELQTNYRAILDTLENVTPVARDSVLAHAAESLDLFSVDTLGMTGESGQPTYISDNLERARSGFLERAAELADRCWRNMRLHKQESLRVEARAKRNIVTMLILTSIVSIFMILVLPGYIVRPITGLRRIFRKAEEGDMSAVAQVKSDDEIGSLALSYNRMLERLREYDDLKTKKIASRKRAFDRFLETLDVPACILNDELRAVFYNGPFTELFNDGIPAKAPETGFDITAHDVTKDFAERIKDKIQDSVSTFTITLDSTGGGTVTMRGRLVRNALMELETIVLAGTAAVRDGE